MILFHGSFVVVDKPDLLHSRFNVDFGKGFYVTPIYKQAEKWSKRFKKLGKDGIITSYKFDESAYKILKVLSFDTYSEDWLIFFKLSQRERYHKL